LVPIGLFHLYYTKFTSISVSVTMSYSNNFIAPPRLVRSESSAHYAVASSPLRRANSRSVQPVPFGLTRSYSNAPPLMRTESGEVYLIDDSFDEAGDEDPQQMFDVAIDTVDLATDWFPRDNSAAQINMHEPLHGGRVTHNAVYQGADLNGCGYGAGTIAFDDGATYYGEWTNDRFHGNGIFSAGNHPKFAGRTYNGIWRTEDTQLYGEGTISFLDGSLYVGRWMNGYRHGHGTYTDASGEVVFAGVWHEDRPSCQT